MCKYDALPFPAAHAAPTQVFFLLVFCRIEIADTGKRFAEVADFVRGNAAFAIEESGAVLGQRVAVRSGQPDSGDDDTLCGIHSVHDRVQSGNWQA